MFVCLFIYLLVTRNHCPDAPKKVLSFCIPGSLVIPQTIPIQHPEQFTYPALIVPVIHHYMLSVPVSLKSCQVQSASQTSSFDRVHKTVETQEFVEVGGGGGGSGCGGDKLTTRIRRGRTTRVCPCLWIWKEERERRQRLTPNIRDCCTVHSPTPTFHRSFSVKSLVVIHRHLHEYSNEICFSYYHVS